jgi:Uma2 family endonuclease
VSTTVKRLSVKTYDAMVENGILPETNRFELIGGRIVEKDMKDPAHVTATLNTLETLRSLVPPGWHVRAECPVRIPVRRSEPEPDISVVRGTRADYRDHHPGPSDVALVVEVTRTTAAKDRKLARVYGPGGIPVYWIVNASGRQLEVYSNPVGGQYPPPTILGETESVELIIAGAVVGRIAVADLLP